jgi:hypothetical protein
LAGRCGKARHRAPAIWERGRAAQARRRPIAAAGAIACSPRLAGNVSKARRRAAGRGEGRDDVLVRVSPFLQDALSKRLRSFRGRFLCNFSTGRLHSISPLRITLYGRRSFLCNGFVLSVQGGVCTALHRNERTPCCWADDSLPHRGRAGGRPRPPQCRVWRRGSFTTCLSFASQSAARVRAD